MDEPTFTNLRDANNAHPLPAIGSTWRAQGHPGVFEVTDYANTEDGYNYPVIVLFKRRGGSGTMGVLLSAWHRGMIPT